MYLLVWFINKYLYINWPKLAKNKINSQRKLKKSILARNTLQVNGINNRLNLNNQLINYYSYFESWKDAQRK